MGTCVIPHASCTRRKVLGNNVQQIIYRISSHTCRMMIAALVCLLLGTQGWRKARTHGRSFCHPHCVSLVSLCPLEYSKPNCNMAARCRPD